MREAGDLCECIEVVVGGCTEDTLIGHARRDKLVFTDAAPRTQQSRRVYIRIGTRLFLNDFQCLSKMKVELM